MFRLIAWVFLGIIGTGVAVRYENGPRPEQRRDLYLRQLENDDAVSQAIRTDYTQRNAAYAGGVALWLVAGAFLFRRHIGKALRMTTATLVLLGLSGCYRPVEPVKLELIKTNEEGFLIPLTGDTKKQVSTASEEFLKASLVHTKQVKIPQQWVQTGWYDYDGSWRDAAVLIVVDRTPVTREWTADPNSGTSKKNEAVWVQSSDQVEWSTGWTCTGRIAGREDAVKFLANYPNGALSKVMDEEVRAKIQSLFGLAVTDIPMEKLRKESTPIMMKTILDVTTFFKDRGITITNLGITGGYIYKDQSIRDMMVKVFNAEQGAAIARADTESQREKNKAIELEGEAQAAKIVRVAQAEADGINTVAAARQKEIEITKENPEAYVLLRRMEIEVAKIKAWNGSFPAYFVGSGQGPETLLQIPAFTSEPKPKKGSPQ